MNTTIVFNVLDPKLEQLKLPSRKENDCDVEESPSSPAHRSYQQITDRPLQRPAPTREPLSIRETVEWSISGLLRLGSEERDDLTTIGRSATAGLSQAMVRVCVDIFYSLVLCFNLHGSWI